MKPRDKYFAAIMPTVLFPAPGIPIKVMFDFIAIAVCLISNRLAGNRMFSRKGRNQQLSHLSFSHQCHVPFSNLTDEVSGRVYGAQRSKPGPAQPLY